MKSNKKAKTLMERMGFKDDDLKTTLHDEIFLYLSNKENILKMMRDMMVVVKYLDSYSEEGLIFPYEGIKWDNQIIISVEKPIMNEKQFTLGFVDLEVSLSSRIPSEFKNKFKGILQWFHKCNNEEHRIDGIVIEIKSNLINSGEIFREINYYKSNYYKGEYLWVVVAPSCNFKEKLEEFGIYVYELKQFNKNNVENKQKQTKLS